MARIILDSRADIVCIQEVQVDADAPNYIGADIGPKSRKSLQLLYACICALGHFEARWLGAVSGVNARKSGATRLSGTDKKKRSSMRDAYAFFWQGNPKSDNDDGFDEIRMIGDPDILLSEGFSLARRPGIATFLLRSGAACFPVNIISWHAPTTDTAQAINLLATFPEIGGTRYAQDEASAQIPLPEIDTIMLGDFNSNMEDDDARTVYRNLADNYQLGVGDFGTYAALTTYSTRSPVGDVIRNVSAFDNIFLLKKSFSFNPQLLLVAQGGAVIDFIGDKARTINDSEFQVLLLSPGTDVPGEESDDGDSMEEGDGAGAIELGEIMDLDEDDGGGAMDLDDPLHDLEEEAVDEGETSERLRIVFKRGKKNQHAVDGISDHLPVRSDFTWRSGATPSFSIAPTKSGCDSLYHAVFGTLDQARGMYVDSRAVANREEFIQKIYQLKDQFPAAGALRSSLLASVSIHFGNYGRMTVVAGSVHELLAKLRANPDLNPFQKDDNWEKCGWTSRDKSAFTRGFGNYLKILKANSWHYRYDLELLAWVYNIRIVAWVTTGQEVAAGKIPNSVTLNESGQGDRNIQVFCTLRQFFRWQS
jgi:hypothetical protein